MIPKIIHQTWKCEPVPEKWQPLAQSWRDCHPAWEYRLWTDETARSFIAGHYPDFLQTFDAFPHNIQRADAIRYFVLNHFGGVYADLDTLCLRPIDDLLAGESLVLTWEPEDHARALNHEMMLSNAFMASAPGHPFWCAVFNQMNALKRTPEPSSASAIDVLHSTGPLMLQTVYETSTELEMTILPSHVISPVTAYDKELDRWSSKHLLPQEKERLIASGTAAIHLWASSWAGPIAGQLTNPHPDRIAGFIFLQGWDSTGFDIGNWGRDIPATGARARTDSRVVAFNTDGNVKHYVRPRRDWRRRGFMAPNEGLYIRRDPRLLAKFVVREGVIALLTVLHRLRYGGVKRS